MLEQITTILGLIVVNLVLSGDNAVLIGMAAHRLKPKQRTIAIVCGGLLAVVLRIVLTALAAFLMQIPALRFIGGASLVWIAYKLLNEEVGEEESHEAAESLRQAMWIIIVADIVMSLDNILGVAAVSRGDWGTMIAGLAMSMPLVLFGGGVVAMLMNRLPWLNYVGAIVIAWTAGEMMLSDQFVRTYVPETILVERGIPLLLAVGVPVITNLLTRRAAAREAAAPALANSAIDQRE